MSVEVSNGAHSAQVKMRLIINGELIRITHMGGNFVRIEQPRDCPPCDATIFMQVDASKREWKVRLPEGISKDSERVALALPT